MQASANGFHLAQEGVGTTFQGVNVVEGQRTPFGKFCGALSGVSPTDLGILSSRAVLDAAGIEGAEIDQTIVANVGQASSDSFFLPRHIALYSGARQHSPALLVQRICGSGIELIGTAAEQICLGKARLVLGCGTDTMSRFPLVSYTARQGFGLGRPEFSDLLWEALDDTAAVPMGRTADILAERCELEREEVDRFAMRSQQRYAKAAEAGFFGRETVSVESRGSFEIDGLKPRRYRIRGREPLTADEHPRLANLEQLSKLPPVFSEKGPTTAGSASGIVDGACSVLIASDDYLDAHSLAPLGKILAMASVGVEPEVMGIGPVPAIRAVLKASELKLNDIELFEINEAFAAQCLAVARELELDEERLNVHGGAIAIGHPLAATGCRLVTTCLKGLEERDARFGIAAACIGGGQGIAMLLERQG
jgi:acetyl-CoA C-acetyltransferase